MLTLDQLRQIDPAFKDCPDAVLEAVRARLYALGQFAFEEWLKGRNRASRAVPNPLGVVYYSSGYSPSGRCTI